MEKTEEISRSHILLHKPSEIAPANANLRIVHSESKSNGEEVHLVRPTSENFLSTNDIVNRLLNQYSYKIQGVIAEK
jgi:hypothetical protein